MGIGILLFEKNVNVKNAVNLDVFITINVIKIEDLRQVRGRIIYLLNVVLLRNINEVVSGFRQNNGDKMYKLTITQGCPGSGKTTYAKTLVATRCNRDDIRREYFPSAKWPFYQFSKENENKVTEIQKDFIRKMGKISDVIVDDTNLNNKTVEMFRRLADEVGMSFEIKQFFDCGIGELLKRNIEREHSVPEDVIVRMYKQQMEMQGRILIRDPALPHVVLCDIDGTVADCGKGEKWGRSPFEWAKVGQDKPIEHVVDLIKLIATKYPIIFVSGRDGCCRSETIKWLNKHFPFASNLYMRCERDMRKDDIVKEEIVKDICQDFYPRFLVDDRKQVTYHLRCIGLPVFQVDFGLF